MLSLMTPEQKQASLENIRPLIEPTPGVTIQGIKVRYMCPDSYIYCTSEFCSTSLFKEFGDTCIEIQDPTAFFLKLQQALNELHSQAFAATWGRCNYNRVVLHFTEQHGDSRLLPHFYKPISMAYQREVRACFFPTAETQEPLNPRILEIPSIISHCRILTLAEHLKAVEDSYNFYTQKTFSMPPPPRRSFKKRSSNKRCKKRRR